MIRDEIVRRYFVINSFEGILTVFALILAFYFSHPEVKLMLISCLSALVSMAIAGFSIAIQTEYAERKRELKEVEKHMLKSLKGSILDKRKKMAILLAGITEGFSPVLFGLICLSPFFICLLNLLDFKTAFLISFSLICLSLIWLGYELGKIIGETPLKYSFFLLASGLSVGFICFLISKI